MHHYVCKLHKILDVKVSASELFHNTRPIIRDVIGDKELFGVPVGNPLTGPGRAWQRRAEGGCAARR